MQFYAILCHWYPPHLDIIAYNVSTYIQLHNVQGFHDTSERFQTSVLD